MHPAEVDGGSIKVIWENRGTGRVRGDLPSKNLLKINVK
jgi:hypothetical protein